MNAKNAKQNIFAGILVLFVSGCTHVQKTAHSDATSGKARLPSSVTWLNFETFCPVEGQDTPLYIRTKFNLDLPDDNVGPDSALVGFQGADAHHTVTFSDLEIKHQDNGQVVFRLTAGSTNYYPSGSGLAEVSFAAPNGLVPNAETGPVIKYNSWAQVGITNLPWNYTMAKSPCTTQISENNQIL